MRTSLFASMTLLAFMGCQHIAQTDFYLEPVWLPLEFEWVEPLDFQHKLITCREADTCSVDSLF